MDIAINKSTDRPISAFEVYKNGSYQNLNKGEWIAPKDSISNWEEISEEDRQVHHVTMAEITYKSGKTGLRCPHFAVYPNSKAITYEIDPTHKKLQEWLFNRLASDDLELCYSKGTKPHKYENKIKLSELDINWNDYSIEVTTKAMKKLRADILLPFKKKHSFLGEGIFFEIQLSEQNKSRTHLRSIERALHGYSTCWLFEKDFIIEEDNIQLKNNLVILNSFSEQIHYAKSSFVGKLKDVVEEQCRFLDDKIAETMLCIESLEQKEEEITNSLKQNSERLSLDIISKLNTREANLLNKISLLEGNPFAGLVENYKKQIEEKKDWFFIQTNLALEKLSNTSEIIKRKLNYPSTFGICPRCNQGYMVKRKGRFGIFYSCSNWKRDGTGCNHIINIKGEGEGNGEVV